MGEMPSRRPHPRPPRTSTTTTESTAQPARRPSTRGAAERYAAAHSLTLPIYPFPLTPHPGSGQWSKRHAGRTHYFGPLDDPISAYRAYLRDWPRITRGLHRRPLSATTPPTLEMVATAFLRAQEIRIEDGTLKRKSFLSTRDSIRIALSGIEGVGSGLDGSQRYDLLRPIDFDRLADLFRGKSLSFRDHLVTAVHAMCSWAAREANGGLPIPDYGSRFTPPTSKMISAEVHRTRSKPLSAPTILRLIAHADPTLRAALLLAINSGSTQSDLSHMPFSDLILGIGPSSEAWSGAEIKGPRWKTSILRRIPLWPETLIAIELARCPYIRTPSYRAPSKRPRTRPIPPTDPDAPLLLSQYGKRLWRNTENGHIDLMGEALRRCAQRAGLTLPGGWRLFRSTFDTWAADVRDDKARRIIMGHKDHEMDDRYITEFPIERLLSITTHIRARLLGLDTTRTARQSVEESAASTASEVAALRAKLDQQNQSITEQSALITRLLDRLDASSPHPTSTPPLPSLEAPAADAVLASAKRGKSRK